MFGLTINLSNVNFTSPVFLSIMGLVIAMGIAVFILYRFGAFEGIGTAILGFLFRDKSDEADERKRALGWFGKEDRETRKDWFGKKD